MPGPFLQAPPRLANTFTGDLALVRALERALPPVVFAEVVPGLERLGARAAGEMLALTQEAEGQPPRLVPFDPWGGRIDHIETSPAWRRLHGIAAEEGVLAVAYEARHGELSRLEQFARLYLFHPSSAFVSCPLAMSDGAARVISRFAPEALKARVLPHLVARRGEDLWTSGQWMTERGGGSDVSGTETVAQRNGESFRLFGTKWFTSATTAEIALTLGRIEGAPEGSRGLTLFYVELADGRADEGRADEGLGDEPTLRVLRLKDKLGTKALPTAELELAGLPATQIGEVGRGVATVAAMLNITRLYNATCAVSALARGLALARDYAGRRRAFGKPLAEHPLHLETLAAVATEHRAGLAATLRAFELLGREEAGTATSDELLLLRALTPLVKLATGKQAVAGTSELLECFGGAGYIEDTGLPRLLRDAQVFPIWEGTTNVLALDLLRALETPQAMAALEVEVLGGLREDLPAGLRASAERLGGRFRRALTWHRETQGRAALEVGARAFAFELYRAWAGALLLRQTSWELARGQGVAASAAAQRWATPEEPWASLSQELAVTLAMGS